jgi:hypothetical protein
MAAGKAHSETRTLSTKYVFCEKSARCVSLDSAESGWSAPMAKMHSYAVTNPNTLDLFDFGEHERDWKAEPVRQRRVATFQN